MGGPSGTRVLLAAPGDDADRLAAALAAATAAGLGGTEVVSARERLCFLRARGGAAQELRDAAQSADVYRLRAALSNARTSAVNEKEIQQARDTLKALESQAHAR